MILYVNCLIEWLHSDAILIERVIWISPTGEDILLIDVQERFTWPKFRTRDEVFTNIEGNTAKILDKDLFMRRFPTEEELEPEYIQRRDKAWLSIEFIIINHLPDLAYKYRRGKLISAAAKQYEVSGPTITARLRCYLQGGMVKNALYPNFHNSGGKGKEKKSDKKKKRGFLTKSAQEKGLTGINITPNDQAKIRSGAELFYENTKNTFKEAHILTLGRFYHEGHEIRNGVKVPVLPPLNELPTLGQFKYWYYKMFPARKRKSGLKEPDTDYENRPFGDSTLMAYGPGYVFQGDATQFDTCAVSLFTRSIIGWLTLYIIIDVWSRMIVGYYLGLENASWRAAKMALECTFTNKVEFCARFGITIKPEEWPCHHIPESLLGDRGEFELKKANVLVTDFGIRLDNTAPYSPEDKAIVEQDMNQTKEQLLDKLPGTRSGEVKPGDKDIRLDAALTVYELNRVMIRRILKHNNTQKLEKYPLTREMLKDRVRPIPRELWNWGMTHRTGLLRTMPADIVRKALLERGSASVTPEGIYFNKLYYTCKTAENDGWFKKAQEHSWRITVVYHFNDPETIYYTPDGINSEIEPCQKLPRSRGFSECTFADVMDHYEMRALEDKLALDAVYQQELEYDAQIKAEVKPAVKEAKEARAGLSKAAQLANIREDREFNLQLERTQRLQEFKDQLGDVIDVDNAEIHSPSEGADEADVSAPTYIELLKKHQKKENKNED